MRMPRTLSAVALAVGVVAGLAATAEAQRGPYGGERYDGGTKSRNVAGEFDYYALVLSWSPTHCASLETNAYDPQCHRRDGRRYNFVLHGLWPQYTRGYPEYCSIGRRPFVPQTLVDGMQDIMPSARLTIHEYKKHGTCSGLDPAAYYDLSRRLFKSITIPHRYINPFEAQFVTPDDLVDEILAENPKLEPDMLAVVCGGPGNRLREVRICFSKAGEPTSCGDNESQKRLCAARQMFVPPVRSTATGPESGVGGKPGEKEPPSPLPGPRVIPSPRSL
ncbi:MAG: ribonuclease T [Pseudomonadota bacterium]